MSLRVVLILRLPLSDLMRPPLHHIKYDELEKCCGRISNIVGVITLMRAIFNGVSKGNCGVLGFALLRYVILVLNLNHHLNPIKRKADINPNLASSVSRA